MSMTLSQPTALSNAFENVMSDLKAGVASATAAQAEASKKAVTAAKGFVAFNQGTLEAISESGKLLAAGSQDLIRAMTDSNKAAYTAALSGLRSLMSAKTFKERLELQASLTQAAATRAVNDGSHFAQASLALAEKAAAPLTARALAAADALTSLKA